MLAIGNEATPNTASRCNNSITRSSLGEQIQDNTRYGLHREVAANYDILKNGSATNINQASVGLSSKEIYIGGYNSNGIFAGGSSYSSSHFHAMISPDLSALNTELTLLESLFIV